ncbi:uncharacterized protein LOC106165268 [Lingula anatina]|uniref:Uncharacterized protein LOC106165268 n=1 Tax=Lingula anatina TaxID=7574 RepID=A0A1S3ILW6_LINAN|nr:uncharacterized protein LOC106165268 [Lingula anatina]|eukprot:XP_013398886.1 uncharacterized protein LOC106165268 [Lingula anatina]
MELRASERLRQSSVVKICLVGGGAGALCAVMICAVVLSLALDQGFVNDFTQRQLAANSHPESTRNEVQVLGSLVHSRSKRWLNKGQQFAEPSSTLRKRNPRDLEDKISGHKRHQRNRRSVESKPSIHLVPKTGGNPSVAPVLSDGTFCHWRHLTLSNDGSLYYDAYHNVVVITKPGVYYVYGQVYVRATSDKNVSFCLFRGHRKRHKWFIFDLNTHDLSGALVCGLLQPRFDFTPTQFQLTNEEVVIELPRDKMRHAYRTRATSMVSGVFYFDENDTVSMAIAGGTDVSEHREDLQIGLQHNFTYFGAFMV